MTNNELEQLLKAAKVPERENSFWENFSQNVRRRISSESRLQAATPEDRLQAELRTGNEHRPKPNFALWGIGLATACLVIGFWFGFRNGHSRGTKEQLAAARKYFQEVGSLFPNQLKSMSFGKKGSHLVLSETANVPTSSPIFVRIFGTDGWKSFVTFSGQQIQINGENCDVLIDSEGKVLLVGTRVFWSQNLATREAVHCRVEAFTLEKSL